ncbi:hypothetical protein EV363DRAFT_1447645 [Boletus edulis]|nr:hypothetical protein EV363DRAFT_1447645 [Boletus edulis]
MLGQAGKNFGIGPDGLLKALQDSQKHASMEADATKRNTRSMTKDTNKQSEKEAEAPKRKQVVTKKMDKGKSKTIPVDVNMSSDENDSDQEPATTGKGKGKKAIAKPRKTVKAKVPKVKRKDVQFIMEQIHRDLKEATLGYALMTFVDSNDMGSGPKLVTQTINPHSINLKYSRNFKQSVSQKGLQNRKVENAIVVGVKKEWLDMSSLEHMHEGVYENSVIWTKSSFPKEISILYNGNHRFHYESLLKLSTAEEKQLNETTVNTLELELRQQGVWLVRFMDLAIIQQCEDPAVLEHHLATNSTLANLEDTEDIKVSQVLLMMASMSQPQRDSHVASLCAQLMPSSHLYKILKDKGLYTAAMKLLAWKHFHGTSSGAGLTVRHLLMEKFADHMTQTLVFLSLPLEVPSIETVNRETTKKNVNLSSFHKHYVKLILEDMNKMVVQDMECHCLVISYLDAWMKDFVNLISTTNQFEKFGSKSSEN